MNKYILLSLITILIQASTYAQYSISAGNDVTISKGSSTQLNAEIAPAFVDSSCNKSEVGKPLQPVPTSCSDCSNTATNDGEWINANSGTKWFIPQSIKNVHINLNGGTVIVAANNATIAINYNSGTCIVYGTALLQSLNINSGSNMFVNYGNLTITNFTSQAVFENHGIATFNGTINCNQGSFINDNTILANNSFTISSSTIVSNNGSTTIKGILQINSGAQLLNTCNIITNVLNNNGTILNTGTISYTGGSIKFAPIVEWSPSTGLSAVSILNPTANPITSTLYTVNLKQNNTIIATDQVMVTVEQNTVTNKTLSLCLGSSATLTAANAASWKWNTGATSQSITINPTISSTFSVTATSSGNISIENTAVTIYELPTIALVNTTVCPHTAVDFIPGSFTSYLWSDGSTNNHLQTQTPGNYSVTVVDLHGCSASKTVSLSNYDAPAQKNASTNLCFDSGLMLDADSFNAYLWDNGSTTQTRQITNPGVYVVTVTETNTSGCSTQSILSFTANKNPVIALQNAIVCPGMSFDFMPGSFASYLWSDGSSNNHLQVQTPGNYLVTVVDLHGCSASKTVSLSNYDAPAQKNASTNLCFDTSLMLDAGSFNAYLWDNGSITQTRLITNENIYVVSVTEINQNGCSTQSVLSFSTHKNPVVDIKNIQLCKSYDLGKESIVVNADPLALYASYVWNTGSNQSSIQITAAGNYSVTVTSAANCSGSKTITVTENFFWYGDMNQSMNGLVNPTQTITQWSADADIAKSILISLGILPNSGNATITITPDVINNRYILKNTTIFGTTTTYLSSCFETQLDVDLIPGPSAGDWDTIRKYFFSKTNNPAYQWPILSTF